jgi:hypothetical protein
VPVGARIQSGSPLRLSGHSNNTSSNLVFCIVVTVMADRLDKLYICVLPYALQTHVKESSWKHVKFRSACSLIKVIDSSRVVDRPSKHTAHSKCGGMMTERTVNHWQDLCSHSTSGCWSNLQTEVSAAPRIHSTSPSSAVLFFQITHRHFITVPIWK